MKPNFGTNKTHVEMFTALYKVKVDTWELLNQNDVILLSTYIIIEYYYAMTTDRRWTVASSWKYTV